MKEFESFYKLEQKVNYLEKTINKLIDSLNNLTLNFTNVVSHQTKVNEGLIESEKHQQEINKNILKKLKEIERKLQPENPGDINHLYQNWDKDDTIN